MHSVHRTREWSTLVVAVLVSMLFAGWSWPWSGDPWPTESSGDVVALDHPTLEQALAARPIDPEQGYRFVAFGDQRALADGEWQDLMSVIARHQTREARALFMIDSGDIVNDGSHADQFVMLRGILEPARELPYLVVVGNHELQNMKSEAARVNTARFLSYLDPELDHQRRYYRKDIGPATFLFLDSNPWVYGQDGEQEAPAAPAAGSQGAKQFEWLRAQLASLDAERTVIVGMHHPILQSSKKHRETARALWNLRFEGRRIVDILADGGVDLVITGHTHTYERFRLQRDDGRVMHIVNISGRPRTNFLWAGDGARRARDLRGEEMEWFADKGFDELERWSIEQREAMRESDRNQFAEIDVAADGELSLRVYFVDTPDDVRSTLSVVLR